MKWEELLTQLDAARDNCTEEKVLGMMMSDRIQLRQRAGKELHLQIPEHDAFAQRVQELIAPFMPAPASTPIADDLLACLPPEDERPPLPEGAQVVERGDGEGRMIVMPRETKLVVREPVLEEADEDTVGKD